VENVEAIQQILTKLSRGDRILYPVVRGRNDAHIDLERIASADAGDRGRFEHAKEPDLEVEGHLRDFVSKQGSSLVLSRSIPGAFSRLR
jgi:hypothetical protein